MEKLEKDMLYYIWSQAFSGVSQIIFFHNTIIPDKQEKLDYIDEL